MKKKILLTFGATIEYLDDVRIITNISTGKLGLTIYKVLKDTYNIEIITGKYTCLPSNITRKIHKITNTLSCYKKVKELLELRKNKYFAAIHIMAVSDYTPYKKKGKISTEKGPLTIKLYPTKKIASLFKRLSPGILLITAKLCSTSNEEKALKEGIASLKKYNSDFVIVNRIQDITSTYHKAIIIDKKGDIVRKCKTKLEIARCLKEILDDKRKIN